MHSPKIEIFLMPTHKCLLGELQWTQSCYESLERSFPSWVCILNLRRNRPKKCESLSQGLEEPSRMPPATREWADGLPRPDEGTGQCHGSLFGTSGSFSFQGIDMFSLAYGQGPLWSAPVHLPGLFERY